MRKVVISSVAVVLVTYLVFAVSCGETDPTLAPVGAIVTLNQEDISIDMACNESTARCDFAGGYWVWLVQALVQDGGEHTIPGDATPGGEALNNVEIRFYTDGSSFLYLQEDDIFALPPLAEPYYTETDERGVAWIKWVVPALTECGAMWQYHVTADVGTSAAVLKANLSCEEPEEEEEE